jgi:hypothetical protein
MKPGPLVFALAAGLLLVDSGSRSVQAQELPPRGAGEERRGPPDVIALQQMFDSFVLLQSQRQLQIRPDQAPQFIARLTELQEARRRAVRQRAQILQELRRLTPRARGRGDEGGEPRSGQDEEIVERLKRLDEVEARSAQEVRQALANLDQVLAPRQRARFRILEEQLERNKLEILMRARQGR